VRYKASEFGDGWSVNQMSRIQVDRDSKTRNFAFGITELEAGALIDKMMEVHNFRKHQAE